MNDEQDFAQQAQQEEERRREQEERERTEREVGRSSAGTSAVQRREVAGPDAEHRPAFGQAPVFASVNTMGDTAAASASGHVPERKSALPKGRSLLGLGVLALALTGVVMGFMWWKQSRYVSPTLVGQTHSSSLPDVLDSVQADHTAPATVPPLTMPEAAPAPVTALPTDAPPVTAEPTVQATTANPLQVDEGQVKPVETLAPTATVSPAAQAVAAPASVPVDTTSAPMAQSQEQRIALLEQQVAQLMEAAKPRRVAPRSVSAATSTARVSQARGNASAKTAQTTTSRPEVALLSVDMWGGKPSVVVGTTDPANTQVRVLKPGDSLNGVTLKQVDVSGQKATFDVGGQTVELSREN